MEAPSHSNKEKEIKVLNGTKSKKYPYNIIVWKETPK